MELKFFKAVVDRFLKYDIGGLAAELSFYLISSFFPFMILLIAIISLTPLSAEETLFQLLNTLPNDTYNIIVNMLTNLSRSNMIIIMSIAISLWSMSNTIKTISKALNRFYKVKEERHFIRVRVYGIIFAFSIAMAIILTFVLLILGSTLLDLILKYLPYTKSFWNIVRITTVTLILALVFAMLFKTLPNIKLKFKNVVPGALLAAIAWSTSSTVFSFYVDNFSKNHIIYGSLAGIVVLVTWLYMTSFIILICGAINSLIPLVKREVKYKKPRIR